MIIGNGIENNTQGLIYNISNTDDPYNDFQTR